MANVGDDFVSKLGRTAVCNYITTANAACAELRAAGRQGVIKQDFMGKLRIPALLAHKQWTIAKIFEVILLLDVLNGVLVTRGVFPWSFLARRQQRDRLVFCGAGRGGAKCLSCAGRCIGSTSPSTQRW